MDVQFWLTLIIIAVSLIARAWKNFNKPENRSPNEPSTPSETAPGKGPVSFEELLREIQASKTPPSAGRLEESKQLQPSKPIKSYDIDYDDDLEEEEKDLETIPANDTRSTEIYEAAKREAFSRKSLEETMKLSDTEMKYSHFKGYDEAPQKNLGKEILQEFKDPEGFKKAFIMSEILKRKF